MFTPLHSEKNTDVPLDQDLDYSYSPVGDLPKYMPALAFPPSYFHKVIRTGPHSSNPIVHIDLSQWGEQIAANLQLLQDRVRTETCVNSFSPVNTFKVLNLRQSAGCLSQCYSLG